MYFSMHITLYPSSFLHIKGIIKKKNKNKEKCLYNVAVNNSKKLSISVD